MLYFEEKISGLYLHYITNLISRCFRVWEPCLTALHWAVRAHPSPPCTRRVEPSLSDSVSGLITIVATRGVKHWKVTRMQLSLWSIRQTTTKRKLLRRIQGGKKSERKLNSFPVHFISHRVDGEWLLAPLQSPDDLLKIVNGKQLFPSRLMLLL